MTYNVALSKAWRNLESLIPAENSSVQLLNDNYTVDLKNRQILSLSCNIPAKEHVSILILHYLIRKSRGLPPLKGEWISFRELEGGDGYYPTFKKRTIEPIMRKYGSQPEAILTLVERFNAKKTQIADISVVLEVFEGVPVLVTLWRSDEEFGPEANILFDKSVKDIFHTEDIVVLAEFVANSI